MWCELNALLHNDLSIIIINVSILSRRIKVIPIYTIPSTFLFPFVCICISPMVEPRVIILSSLGLDLCVPESQLYPHDSKDKPTITTYSSKRRKMGKE